MESVLNLRHSKELENILRDICAGTKLFCCEKETNTFVLALFLILFLVFVLCVRHLIDERQVLPKGLL